jgi:hypothetical protein
VTRRALVLFLFLLGCKRSVELRRIQLPGFSLELPSSMHYTGDGKTDYRSGQLHDIGDRYVVFVAWQPGEAATVEEMPIAVKAVGEVVPQLARMSMSPARSYVIGSQQATRLDTSYEGVAITFIDISCGKRSVMVAFGAEREFEQTRDRILDSFQCHPNAAEDTAIAAAVPIGVDDPSLVANWFRVKNDDAFAMSDGQLILVAVSVPNAGDMTGMVDKIIPTMFDAAGAKWLGGKREQHGAREFQRGVMEADGERTAGVISIWRCDGTNDALMVLALAPDEDAVTTAIDFVGKLRCARRDDPPLPLRAPSGQ